MITLTEQDLLDLCTINQLPDILTPVCSDKVKKMASITRSTMRRREA